MAEAGPGRRRRRLAGAARRRPRAGGRQGRAGQPRPGRVPRRRGRWWPSARATCCAATAAGPATCSTSATACCPRLDPDVLAAVVDLVHEEGRADGRHGGLTRLAELGLVVMAYGTPATPADIEAYYTHIRRGHAPTPEQLADLTARYEPSAAPRRWPSAPRRSGWRWPPRSTRPSRAAGRSRSGRSTQRRSSRTPSRRWPTTACGRRRRARARAALRARVRRPVPRAPVATQPASTALPVRPIESWHLEPAYLDFLTDAVRDGAGRPPGAHEGAVHRPLAARAGAGGRPVPGPAASLGRGRGGGGRARPLGGLVPVLAVGRTHRRSVAGPRHPRGDRRPRRHRPGRRGARVPAGVRERPPRGGLRPRHRGPPPGRGARAGLRPHPRPQRRPGRARGAGRHVCARPRRHEHAAGRRRRRRRGHHRAGGRPRARPRRAPRVTVVEPHRSAGRCATRPFDGGDARRGGRRVPGPGARGRRAVPCPRHRGHARLPRRAPGLRVEPRRAAAAARGAGARRAHRPRRAGRRPASCPSRASRPRGRDLTTPLVAPDDDPTIGALLRGRLGDEVVDRLSTRSSAGSTPAPSTT